MNTHHLDALADQFIEAPGDGGERLGAIYRFLLRAWHGNVRAARADFVRYLGGELPPRLMRLAREEVAKLSDSHKPRVDASAAG